MNLLNFFEAIGRIGRIGYLIDTAQAGQGLPFTELQNFSFTNQTWLNQISLVYDTLIRAQSQGMSQWLSVASNFLNGIVSEDNTTLGSQVSSSLGYLYAQMVLQGATVKQFNVGSTVTPDVGNVGSGNVFVVLTRADGLLYQNVVAETATLYITADSYTGGATRGQEPWQFNGAPNRSSLGTGVSVGLWDWDWPQGSGSVTSGNCIAAFDYANSSGNFLTNGDFAGWNGSPAAPNNFFLNPATGTWGTTIQQNNTQQLSGLFCVQFNPGGSANELTMQFGSTSTTGTTAGTSVALNPYTGYAFNLWLKSGGPAAGVMSISLVNSSGAVINDQMGTPQTHTINLALVPTTYTPYAFAFRTPVIVPADGIMRLDIKMSTPLSGNPIYMDWLAWALPSLSNTYVGGPNIVVFSNPTEPFEVLPEPDGYTLVFTNDYGGSLYGASLQLLTLRCFQTPGLILPYSFTPTLSDDLITAV